MKIFCVLNICPECHKVVPFIPNHDGTIPNANLQCTDDCYLMIRFAIDDSFIDSLLKGQPLA